MNVFQTATETMSDRNAVLKATSEQMVSVCLFVRWIVRYVLVGLCACVNWGGGYERETYGEK